MTDTITIPLATAQQALVTLENVNPSLVCEMAHHPKKDQHGIGQKCPLEIRHLETIAAIKEVLAQQPPPEQQQARVDVITVTLMREGINKHRARELADHFVNFTLPPPLPEQEPPQYSLKAHWTDDKRIGVVACVTRPDGGVHLIQTIIDPPPLVQRERQPLTLVQIRQWWASENGMEDCEMAKFDDFLRVIRAIEAAHNIKEKP
jgi:hypothetical protein